MSSIVPGAIIFLNTDVSESVIETLVRQLFIDYVITGDDFDGYVAADSTYPDTIKNGNRRALVIRRFDNYSNRNLADAAIYVREGLAAIELTRTEKNGPPGYTYPVVNLTLSQVLGLNGLI